MNRTTWLWLAAVALAFTVAASCGRDVQLGVDPRADAAATDADASADAD
jgi:hypothetical protein